jgi:hypothetical protein
MATAEKKLVGTRQTFKTKRKSSKTVCYGIRGSTVIYFKYKPLLLFQARGWGVYYTAGMVWILSLACVLYTEKFHLGIDFTKQV